MFHAIHISAFDICLSMLSIVSKQLLISMKSIRPEEGTSFNITYLCDSDSESGSIVLISSAVSLHILLVGSDLF